MVGVLVGEGVGVGGTTVSVGVGDGVGVKVGGWAVGVGVNAGNGVAQLTSAGVGVGKRAVAASQSGLNSTSKPAVRQAKVMIAINPRTKY